MPSVSLSDADKTLVTRYAELASVFKTQNPLRHLIVTCTHRTPEEQFQLYQHGRAERNGVWVLEDASKWLTDKSGKPGDQSLHNLTPARAIDVAVCIGGKVTWDYREYLPLGPLAARFNLEWGGNWLHRQDYPHLQLPQETP